MALLIPTLSASLQALSACVAIPPGELAGFAEGFFDKPNIAVAQIEQDGAPRFVRLLSEKFTDGRGHLHLDVVMPGVIAKTPSAKYRD